MGWRICRAWLHKFHWNGKPLASSSSPSSSLSSSALVGPLISTNTAMWAAQWHTKVATCNTKIKTKIIKSGKISKSTARRSMQATFECWAGSPDSMQLVSWSVWLKFFADAQLATSYSQTSLVALRSIRPTSFWPKPSYRPVCRLGQALWFLFSFFIRTVVLSCCRCSYCCCVCCCAHLHLTFRLTVYSSRNFSSLTLFISVIASTTTAAAAVWIINHEMWNCSEAKKSPTLVYL